MYRSVSPYHYLCNCCAGSERENPRRSRNPANIACMHAYSVYANTMSMRLLRSFTPSYVCVVFPALCLAASRATSINVYYLLLVLLRKHQIQIITSNCDCWQLAMISDFHRLGETRRAPAQNPWAPFAYMQHVMCNGWTNNRPRMHVIVVNGAQLISTSIYLLPEESDCEGVGLVYCF